MMLDRRTFVAGALGGALVSITTGRVAAQGSLHEVSIRNFAFDPETLSVQIGDRIRFTNHDLAPHTATADDGSWDTGTLEQGQNVELMVTADWSAEFFCAYHPRMRAVLRIN